MGNIYKVFVVVVITGFLVGHTSLAQGIPAVSGDIQISINPKFPGPREAIRAEAISYSFDAQTASFSWYVNGKSAGSGKGLASISTVTGGVGSATTIEVTAESRDGKEFSKTLTIYPADVDLLWSANTFTPPGYNGKALPTQESTVKIIAMPSIAIGGSMVSPANLLYEWWLDGKKLASNSGLGRSTLLVYLAGNSNVEHTVKLQVSDQDKKSVREKTLTIAVYDPKIAFYELDPLRGPLYNHNIREFSFTAGNEIRMLAVPYFFSSPTAMSYSWSVDNKKLPAAAAEPNTLRYRTQAGSFADQRVSLEVHSGSRRVAPITGSFIMHVR